MIPIKSAENTALAEALGMFDRMATVSLVAGLFTVPEFHPVTLRLEVLAHLACLHCRGGRKPTLKDVDQWLNFSLLHICYLEDPPPDVFISNVMSPSGNYRIFEGVWQANDFYLQTLIDCLNVPGVPTKAHTLRRELQALMSLSDAVAERAGLERWTMGDQIPHQTVVVEAQKHLFERDKYAVFSHQEILKLGIEPALLQAFLFTELHRSQLESETVGHTSFERWPLLCFGDEYVLALPTAVSPAIRRYVLEWMEMHGFLGQLGRVIQSRQTYQTFEQALQYLDAEPSNELAPLAYEEKLPPLATVVCKFDSDKYAHVVLLYDDLDEIRKNGLDSVRSDPLPLQGILGKFLRDTAMALGNRSDFNAGMTLLIMGGLGRGFSMQVQSLPENWHLLVFSISDFMQLSQSEDVSGLQLWKLYQQLQEVTKNGVHLLNNAGNLNLYAAWVRQEYKLVHTEASYLEDKVLITLAADFTSPFRKAIRQRNDIHAVPLEIPPRFFEVRRFTTNSFFPSVQERPIYRNMEAAKRGQLCGVVETSRGPCWLLHEKVQKKGTGYDIGFRLWEGLLIWIDRLLPEIEKNIVSAPPDPIQIVLFIGDMNTIDNLDSLPHTSETDLPKAEVDAGKREVTVRMPGSFLHAFNHPENIGERRLLEQIAFGVNKLFGEMMGRSISSDAEKLVAQVMGGTEARSLHIFEGSKPSDILSSKDPLQPRLIQEEDWQFSKLGLAWSVLKDKDCREVVGTDDCNQFLHGLVDRLWQLIRQRLSQIDRISIVLRAYRNVEALHQDRELWRKTARALQGLHGTRDNVVQVADIQDGLRTTAFIASRVLIEMAVCNSPVSGARPSSTADLDFLLAEIDHLIHCAFDSDAVHCDLLQPHITIHRNGEYSIDSGFYERVVGRYRESYFASDFRRATEAYDKLFEKSGSNKPRRANEVYSMDFVQAVAAEYGLSSDQIIDALAELMDLAYEQGRVVVTTSRNEVLRRLTANRNFSKKEAESFLNAFCLQPRAHWDKTPDGFTRRDWEPWNFRRRLSLMARPLLQLDDDNTAPVLYGIAQLSEGFRYLFARIEAAWLPQEFFSSRKMKEYIGERADVLGNEFTKEVARKFRSLGWECRTEVNMTSLGAPGELGLGDLDVVAWQDNDSRLLLIECKRLQPAHTIGDIGNLFKEFKGEERDRLHRHLQRFQWFEKNLKRACSYFGLSHEQVQPSALLITNAKIPLQFFENFAISPDKVVPIRMLGDWLIQGKTMKR